MQIYLIVFHNIFGLHKALVMLQELKAFSGVLFSAFHNPGFAGPDLYCAFLIPIFVLVLCGELTRQPQWRTTIWGSHSEAKTHRFLFSVDFAI